MRKSEHGEATSRSGGPTGGTDASLIAGSEATGATTLADCLEVLGLEEHELLSLGVQPKGGEFKGTQATVEELRQLDMTEYRDCNVWTGLQPMRKADKRGTSDDVVRIVALPADLDVAENKMPTDQDCMDVIQALSNMLASRPVYVVASGHGYQPVWAVDPEDSTDLERMRSLLERWGKLVQQVAVSHGGSADSVFDPARILRAPGGINWKDQAKPVPTSATLTGGAVVSATEIEEALDAYLHDEVADARDDDFEIPEVETTCRYTRAMVAAWAEDLPAERHPWAVRGAMKLACLRRLGCITENEFAKAREVMVKRMTWLCAHHGGARPFDPSEVDDAIASAMSKTERMPVPEMRQKVGHHDHRNPEDLTWVADIELGTEDVGAQRSDLAPGPQETIGARRIVLTKAADIIPQPTTWLWDKRLPTGALTLIAGPEGTGKSTLAYTLAAKITCGTLTGGHQGTARAVLVAATEDSWARTIVPRLMAAGADLNLVYRIEVVTALGTGGYLTLPKDVPGMEEAVVETGAVMLLLDPLMSRLEAGLDSHKDAETRRALEPIAATAESTGLTVVGLIHFNKSGAGEVLNNVMASKAFTAVARSVSTVIRDPNDDTGRTRIFGTPKNNLGPDDLPLLPFHLVEHTFTNVYGDQVVTSRVEWLAEQHGNMDDLLRQARDTGDQSIVAEVADWLADYLETQGGVASRKDIIDAARKERFSEDQVKRGFKRLGLKYRSCGFPRTTYWMTREEARKWDEEADAARKERS